MLVTLLAVAITPLTVPNNPYAAEVAAALADAKKIGPALAARTLYLTAGWVPAKDVETVWRKAGDYWFNSTSREPELVRMRFVTPTLFAVNVDDYGAVWAKLRDAFADRDPFFHIQVDLIVGKSGQKRYFPADGSSLAGWYPVDVLKPVRVAALAPWTGPAHAELVALCQTAAPILRLDWLLLEIGQQAGRKGTGYFDVLGIKDRDEFDKLVGLDVKASQRVKREVVAIIARSGVANFPRQVYRFQSITGGYWQTRDVLDDNKDARNALRQLDGDYKHQAEEIYGSLPNRLYAFFLCDNNGVRQDTAPDKIGPDKTAPGNDGRIHPESCAACHVEGLRPITDWGRRAFAPPNSLNSPDPVQYRRLAQLYLGEMQSWYDEDNAAYAKTLLRLTGLKPDEMAKVIQKTRTWRERDLLPADAAAELGIDEKVYLAKLRAYYKANQLSDPVLAGHLADPALPLRDDDWQQLQPIVLPIIFGGYNK